MTSADPTLADPPPADSPQIEFVTPAGAIAATLHGATVTAQAITVEFDVTWSAHDAALAGGWFHLGPLTAGRVGRPFGSGPDVRIEACLDPRFLPGLSEIAGTSAAFAQLLTAVDQSSPLRSEASWYARAASRAVPDDDDTADVDVRAALQRGELREGYRTAWSAPGVDGLPLTASLTAVLEGRFHDIEPLDGQSGLRWKLAGSDSSWTSTAVVDEDARWCVISSTVDAHPVGDPDSIIARVNELNVSLLFGTWIVAGHTPTISFRTSIELPDPAVALADLDRFVTRHLDIVDEYASSFT